MGVKPSSSKVDKNFKFTEEFIQNALNNFFAYNSVKYNIDGLYVFDWESDKILETRSGYIYEFEIKISKADFKNDFKKRDKHIILEGEEKYGDKYLPRYYEILEQNKKRGEWDAEYFIQHNSDNKYYLVGCHKKPNYFYYAVPTDLIKVEDVPEYAGLIYVDENKKLIIKKQAPKLHKEKYSDDELKLSEKFYYNMESWKDKYKRVKKESERWKERFLDELDTNGKSMGYNEMKELMESYKKSYQDLKEQVDKSNSQLHKDLYHQNRMVSLLTRELIKKDPNFNIFEFERNHF